MRGAGLIFLGGMLVSLAAVGADSQSAHTANAKSVAKLQQRIAQNQAQVERLQQNVSQQESASQSAAERLQQQDRAIAELRRQLQAVQGAKAASATGH